MSEDPDEKAEKSTVLKHIAVASFPTVHLAPWMTIWQNEKTRALISLIRTMATTGQELERHAWMDEQDGKPQNGSKKPGFDYTERRGAMMMLNTFFEAFAQNETDSAPSLKGLGRKQAMVLGMSQKTGVAVEPKPRSKWERLTGKGKERNQISGME